MTGGVDGFIRVWKYDDIMEAEGDENLIFILQPEAEYELPKRNNQPARIISLLELDKEDKKWLVQDSLGRYYNFWFDKEKPP